MKFALQGIVAMLFLLLFTFCAWYEGSEILDRSGEWKYSTPFSEEVEDSKDISNLDHFVYAAKFRPMFPALMMGMLLYLIMLSGLRVCKGNHNKTASFLTGLGVLVVLLSGLVWESPTVGGNIFKGMCLFTGVVCILLGVLIYLKIPIKFKRAA